MEGLLLCRGHSHPLGICPESGQLRWPGQAWEGIFWEAGGAGEPSTCCVLSQTWLWGHFSESIPVLVCRGWLWDLSCFPQWATTWLSVGNVKLQSMSFLHTAGVTFNRPQHTEGQIRDRCTAFSVNFYCAGNLYPSLWETLSPYGPICTKIWKNKMPLAQ